MVRTTQSAEDKALKPEQRPVTNGGDFATKNLFCQTNSLSSTFAFNEDVQGGTQRFMITIRDANPADLPAIVEIYNASIPSGRSTADTSPISVDDRIEWFKQFDPNKRPIWVAEEDGKIVGCIYLSWFYAGRPAYDATAEISTYIAPDYQGRGLGTLLKEKMIAACPRLGVKNLISMYFDHNEASERLNERLGFQCVGHLPEIADVFGEKRGLKIGLLRIPSECE
jgi:L-amino acid N-acyltransferase YncA